MSTQRATEAGEPHAAQPRPQAVVRRAASECVGRTPPTALALAAGTFRAIPAPIGFLELGLAVLKLLRQQLVRHGVLGSLSSQERRQLLGAAVVRGGARRHGRLDRRLARE